MSKVTIGRRFVLRGMGSLIALPLLESMGCDDRGGASRGSDDRASERTARVEGALGGPKRLITMFWPNGHGHPDDFFPTGGGETFTLGPSMAPWEPYKQDLLLFRGIDNITCDDMVQDGHNEAATSLYTGWRPEGDDPRGRPRGASFDHRIVQATGISVKRPILSLSPEGSGMTLSANDDGGGYSAESSPTELLERLFSDASVSSEEFARRLARRRSILDGVKADYDALARRVSGDDKRRLDAHLTAIRETEERISILNQCDPSAIDVKEGNFGSQMPDRVRSLMDLGILALSCDLSRVVNFAYRHAGGGENYYTWLGLPSDLEHEVHEMSHGPTAFRDELRAIMIWYMEQGAYFVKRLKETPDGASGGTLFDSSVMLHASETSAGNEHSKRDLPFFLVGNAGGHFKTGRLIDYGGVPHNDLLVSLLNAFGVPDTTFGDPACCTGPLSGITA